MRWQKIILLTVTLLLLSLEVQAAGIRFVWGNADGSVTVLTTDTVMVIITKLLEFAIGVLVFGGVIGYLKSRLL